MRMEQADRPRAGDNAATVLAREYARIAELMDTIETLQPCPQRSTLVHRVAIRYLTLVQAEERHLYPAVRRRVAGGEQATAELTCRQRAVSRLVERVERCEQDGADFDGLVDQLVVAVQDHLERHSLLLPGLVEACTIEEIAELGVRLHDGLRNARVAAARAGLAQKRRDRDVRRHGPHVSEPGVSGFRALLGRCV